MPHVVRLVPQALAVIALLATSGCKEPLISTRPDSAASGGDNNDPDDSKPGKGRDGPAFGLGPSADGSPPAAGPEAGAACAEEALNAQQVPVDLLLLVDASSSMATNAGTRSKWDMVEEALLGFARDPRSAGLGVGLQFFPQPGAGSPCEREEDCGYMGGLSPPACQPAMVCAGPRNDQGMLPRCGARNAACTTGGRMGPCAPAGRCSLSGADCVVGQACPPGVAGDTCVARGKRCDLADAETCSTAIYTKPAVPIVALPVPGQRLLTAGLGERGPSGATPMGPAIEGTLKYLTEHQRTHPGRTAALVLATDGVPVGCAPLDKIPAIGELLTRARNGTPSILTYVITVYADNTPAAERQALSYLANAGGTMAPFEVATNASLGERFQEVLNQIRGKALPCEFIIPPPTMGALDYDKVNLRFKGTGGDVDVLYTGTADRCDPVKGGWYYDVDPKAGSPKRIIVCPATCERFRQDTKATVELRFGCKTRVVL